MKFDKKVKEILLEYFHVHFLGDKMYDMDFRIKKFKGKYDDFLNYARNLVMKMQSDRDKQKFKEEVRASGQRIQLALKYAFPEYKNETNVLNKFFKDIGL